MHSNSYVSHEPHFFLLYNLFPTTHTYTYVYIHIYIHIYIYTYIVTSLHDTHTHDGEEGMFCSRAWKQKKNQRMDRQIDHDFFLLYKQLEY